MITAKTINATLFTLDGSPTPTLLQEVPARLKAKAFLDLPPGEIKGFGWSSYDDLTDTAWLAAPPEKGAYYTFALRLDTRKIPPALLKKEWALALKKETEEMRKQGKEFVSRARKREIKEQIRVKLLHQTPAVPKSIGVIWDYSKEKIFFLSTNNKHIDIFTELFTRTFGLSPVEQAQEMDEVDMSQFLLWLWYVSEVTDGSLLEGKTISTDAKMTVSNEDAIVTATGSENEAKLGLREGKTLKSLALRMETGDTSAWQFTLKNGIGQLHSLKLPKVTAGDDDESILFERITLAEEAFNALHHLYERCNKEYPKQTSAIQNWLNA